MADEKNPLNISTGQSVTVQYFGEQIPNQVIIVNLSKSNQANFIIQGATQEGEAFGWSYYAAIEPGRSASVLVEWPSTVAVITNNSIDETTISIGGDGIFPFKG